MRCYKKLELTDSLKSTEYNPCFNLIVASYLIFNRTLQISEKCQAKFWIQFVVQGAIIKKWPLTIKILFICCFWQKCSGAPVDP